MGDEMGSITQLSSDRPRTEWNAAMDQHFIELMLDQVRRGNMIDSTFNKQAWTDMLALFNAKFGPQHSKRVLRHRYNKLSKYYSDLKVIINQDGFSWDETQKMAVADDNVWDAYIKNHPHARAYRMKTLSSFKDLGLIFGNATNNGVQSDLDHGKDLEADISRMKDGEAKGNQIVTVGDRTRTYWTPLMDRYLIDLLLDQVHRGNKVGQTFISQAWSDMVASFNFKFHSNHDKDVLKNRYKHMRRLYNDINNLLGNSGFSWNETREMIVADDHVWDAYTKAHPDARSYRVKTVPSYQKLCIIFGQEICDGRYSRLAQGVGLYGEIPVLRSDAGESSIVLFGSDWPENPSDLDWLPAMDRYFIDLMLEQVRKGGIVEKTISEQAWVHMVQSLNEKFGIKCDKHCLEKRYTILMKECDDISTLLSYHGFEWDATQQIVRADDAVWDAFIEEHPDAIAYRNKVLGSYSSLCQIKRNGNNNVVLEVEADRLPRDINISVEDGIVSDQHRKRPTMAPSGTKCHSKLQKIGLEMQRSIPGIAEAVTTFVNGNGVVLESTIGALQALPDIDDDLLLDACDFLEDEKKAKTFLALDASLRKKWLLRKLRPQQCS
ncbi:hypothetical protein K2173_025974 [Erythroxylum novogranatense]|uniref:Myb/SANT-like domain-containing protein n=1 Tax=Erythroxylum novogranatense TaxID=1862640 RepID=A0AAV8SIJ5_9ROSI|nr:hypothetical protein K2173_025974 [Erythroxylum novogranatense]